MNPLPTFFFEPWVQRLGWILLHFVWQGTLIALLLGIVLRGMQNVSAHFRYLVISAALLLCTMSPAFTLILSNPEAKSTTPLNFGQSEAPTVIQTAEAENAGAFRPGSLGSPVAREPHWRDFIVDKSTPLLPYVVLLWTAGILILTMRLILNWALVQRLCDSGTPIQHKLFLEMFEKLKERMHVYLPVKLLESVRVEVPTLIGCFRPIILMPLSASSGMSPQQLEAILAHELAHVVRHDYLANLLQTILEIIFFYHPAIWWISSKLREERENCCDDIALEIAQNRLSYASALALFEERRSSSLVLSASGGPLLKRIRRIAQVGESRGSLLPILIGLLIVGLISIPFFHKKQEVKDSTSFAYWEEKDSLSRDLVRAVQKSDTAKVKRLLQSGADPEASVYYLDNVLLVAIQNNRSDIVQLLLESGADPNGDTDDLKPINQAIDRGLLPIADILHKAGAKLSSETWAAANGDLDTLKSMAESGTLQKGHSDSAMNAAVAMGHLEVVKFLEKLEGKPVQGRFLSQAAKSGNVRMMEYIIGQGADIKTDGAAALEQAVVYFNQLEAAKYLLAKGANPNRLCKVPIYPNEAKERPLLTCAQDVAMVSALLAAGADPNLQTGNFTPLIYSPDPESVAVLLKHGANLRPELKVQTDFLLAVITRDVVNPSLRDPGSVVSELIKHGVNFDPTGNGNDVIVQAAMIDEVNVVSALLDAGVSPDAHSERFQRSALTEAASNRRSRILKLLLSRGAHPNEVFGAMGSALTYALIYGAWTNVDLLRQAGASDVGFLSEASARGNLEKVRELIQRGSNVNEKDHAGFTPLFYAVRRGNPSIARVLLENGADLNQFSSLGITPYQTFCSLIDSNGPPDWQLDLDGTTNESRKRIGEFKSLFKQFAPDPNFQDKTGQTALQCAAYSGNTSVLSFLLGQKVNVNLTDKNGKTALLLAASSPLAKRSSNAKVAPEAVPQEWNTQAFCVYKLLQSGARVDLKLPNGQTIGEVAMAAAEKSGNAQLLFLLKEAANKQEVTSTINPPSKKDPEKNAPLWPVGEIPPIDTVMSQSVDNFVLNGLNVDDLLLPEFFSKLNVLLRKQNQAESETLPNWSLFVLMIPKGNTPYRVSFHAQHKITLRAILNQLAAQYPLRYQVESNQITVWQISSFETKFDEMAQKIEVAIDLDQSPVSRALNTIQAAAAAQGFKFDFVNLGDENLMLSSKSPVSLQESKISVAQALRSVLKSSDLKLVIDGDRLFLLPQKSENKQVAQVR